MADFRNLNDLSPELKILIVNAQTQLESARAETKEKRLNIDLSAKMQLRDECAELERCIRKIEKGIFKDKDVEKLRVATIRLKTVADGVFRH